MIWHSSIHIWSTLARRSQSSNKHTYNPVQSNGWMVIKINCLSMDRFFSSRATLVQSLILRNKLWGHRLPNMDYNAVVLFEGCGARLALNVIKLIKDINHLHTCMPSASIGNIWHLEGIVDTCIECGEARALDVPHRHEVVLLLIEAYVYCCLFRLCEGGVVDGVAHNDHTNIGWGITGVVWESKWRRCVRGIEFPCHHHSFPAMMEALGTGGAGGYAQNDGANFECILNWSTVLAMGYWPQQVQQPHHMWWLHPL